MRWLVPPPGAHGRLLEEAEAREGLARVEHLHRRVAGVAAATKCAVSVATPERWPRKLSAVRSAVRIGRSGPADVEDGVARLQLVAVGGVPLERQAGAEAAERLVGAGAAGEDAGLARPQRVVRRGASRAPAPR